MKKTMEGVVIKNKKSKSISKEDLELINKLTRREFTEDEVYLFTVVLCDNDIDRDFEKFTVKSLEKLAELFVGKTGILDHKPLAENQTARIFSCKVESVNRKKNKIGEPYKRLVAKAYMPRCEKNDDIILSIDSGIKKEVSVGFAAGNKFCSICGKDQKQEICAHVKGRRYKKNEKSEICHIILENPIDAYEWSFVAVPAQKEAGVIKKFDDLIPEPEASYGQNILKEITVKTTREENTLKRTEYPMEIVMKKLKLGEAVEISENQAKKFSELFKDLEEKAKIGEIYKNEIKEEVLKLSTIADPEFEKNFVSSIVDKLSIEELKTFRYSLKHKISKKMPVFSQLAKEKEEFKNEDIDNFLI